MVEKVMLNDTSKCIGCRGCQVACKQWNQLSAGQTINRGTYQNPADLQPNTWLLLRIKEIVDEKGDPKWLFRKDGCMHCTEAVCEKVCPAGARFRLESGAIGTDNEKCIGCQSCVSACPFNKPRYSEEANKAYKCNLCADRVQDNLPPACVKACSTGALLFGDKGEILSRAYKRARELGKNASVYGDKFFGGTHVIYVLEEKVELYDGLPARPKVASSVIFWKELLKPSRAMEAGIGLTGFAASSLFARRRHMNNQHLDDRG